MMRPRWVESSDGVEIGRVLPERRVPRDRTGWYPLTVEATAENRPPGHGWNDIVVNDGPGVFVLRWVHDADLEAREQTIETEAQTEEADLAARKQDRETARLTRETLFRDYLDDPSPNQAETVRVMKRLIRLALRDE